MESAASRYLLLSGVRPSPLDEVGPLHSKVVTRNRRILPIACGLAKVFWLNRARSLSPRLRERVFPIQDLASARDGICS